MGLSLREFWQTLLWYLYGGRDQDIRVFTLLALVLQLGLMFMAPLRRNKSKPVALGWLIWLFYLTLDVDPNTILGLIVKTRHHDISIGHGSDDVLLLWLPFLLLLCSGHDSMIALTINDNQLWSRGAFQLAAMTCTILSSHYGSLQDNKLLPPVILMLIVGFSRYFERILSNYQARFDWLKESLAQKKDQSSIPKPLHFDDGPNEDDDGDGTISFPPRDGIESDLNRIRTINDAYVLFESLKGVFVDLPTPSEALNESRRYMISKRFAEKAFKIVEIELCFAYDMFYSKVLTICHWQGQCLRLLAILCQVSALVLWYRVDKHSFPKTDIIITYTLLIGTVAGELWSLLRILVSDWTLVRILQKSAGDQNLTEQVWDNYSYLKKKLLSTIYGRKRSYRWSQKFPQHDFFDYCYDHGKTSAIARRFGLSSFYNKVKNEEHGHAFISSQAHSDMPLYPELIRRYEKACRNPDSRRGRGKSVVANYKPRVKGLSILSLKDRSYEETLLLWHIATTLCFHTHQQLDMEDTELDVDPQGSDRRNLHRKFDAGFSKSIAGYMLHILLLKPKMMMEVAAMGEVRYRATLAEAKKWCPGLSEDKADNIKYMELLEKVRSSSVQEDEENSVWFDACLLARELLELQRRRRINMWKVIGRVWVDMVFHAAVECSAREHAAQLANGGDFLTMVWLLLEHFGLGKVVNIDQDASWTSFLSFDDHINS